MSAQVTRKKTLKLKSAMAEEPAAAAASSVAPSVAMGPAPMVMQVPESGAGTSTIIALIATVFFAALLVLQWIEIDFYRDAIPKPVLRAVPAGAISPRPAMPAPDMGAAETPEGMSNAAVPPAAKAVGGAMLGIIAVTGIMGLVSTVCAIITLVKTFGSGAGLGVASLIGGLLTGGLVTCIIGWVKVREHDNKTVMIIWTVAMVVSLVVVIGGLATGGLALMQLAGGA